MPDPRFAALGARILQAARLAVAAHLELADEPRHNRPTIQAPAADDPASDEGAAG
jgi:hypothetical protein